MANLKTLATLGAVPVIALGLFLFRPDRLFVDQKVNERAPVAGNATNRTLGTGAFASYAHETVGNASLVKAGGTIYVRLSNFKTSNGPDVHLYLVKGSDAKATERGFLDLGNLKGNVGDQNYALPPGTDPNAYGSVAIWCKRFNVGFGGAPLTPDRTAATTPSTGFRLAAYGVPAEIVVTHGRLGRGEATIVETGGRRFLRVTYAAPGAHVLLVKAKTIAGDATVKGSPKIDLDVVKAGTQQFPLSKEIDAWLYRSVSLWNGRRSLATAELRSDQEHRAFVPSTLWV